jgi:hypothetical protein
LSKRIESRGFPFYFSPKKRKISRCNFTVKNRKITTAY